MGVDEDRAARIRAMFDRVAGRYDFLNRLLTFGMDVVWRRRAVAALSLPEGSVVLDLACGTADLCVELERAGHRPIGFDFAAGMLARARRRTSAPLVRADVLALPVREAAADGVTIGFALRNVVDLPGLFAEVARAVRPGGRLAIVEVSRPDRALLRLGHGAYLRWVVPVVGGALADREAYAYLPRSVAYLPPPERLAEMLEGTGFREVARTQLSAGIAQVVTATRAEE